MKLYKTKVNFKDARGEIRDILAHSNIDGITIITCVKGAIRGNHYHKKTVQYDYVLSGRMLCASKGMPGGRITKKVLKAGDLAFHPAKEAHAFRALTPCVFLSLTKGPRRGVDFEKDTFRLGKPILKKQ